MNYQENILALIAKFFEGDLDQSERDQLTVWLEKSEDNKQYFEEIRNIYEESAENILKDLDPSKALQKVIKRIELPQRRIWLHYWQRIAGVIILPLLLITGWLLLNKNSDASSEIYNEVFAAFGTRSCVVLADSTVVWLNAGSSLRYPVKFINKTRKVYLSGEAYFEVESDLKRPFIVQTKNIEVKATGTKFNVNEYHNDTIMHVTLVSGKVSIKENNANSSFYSELKPNQVLMYNKTSKERSISNDDVYKYIAWKDGKLIIRKEKLSNVLNRISRIFNVEIEIQDKELEGYIYRATFQDESLEEILRLLKLSAPIKYKELKREPLPDGTFPKKRILIYSDKN